MTSTMTIDEYGDKRWYNQEGQLHRTDSPAVEWADGYKAWYVNGQLHRTLGPAVERANGHKEWWLNSQELTFAQWLDQAPVTEQERTLLLLKFG